MQVKYRLTGSRFKIGLFGTLFTVIKNTYSSRSLVWQLFKRDLVMSNKRSYLGFLWNMLYPLFGIISWLIIQMAGVLKPGDIGVSFPVYILSGTIIYNYFSNFISSARNTLNAGNGFILQVEYHHEALWLYNLLIMLFWSFISLSLNLIVLLILGITPRIEWLLIPFLMIPLFLLGSSLGFILLILDKSIPDLSKVFDLGIPLLYWITPVIYTISTVSNPFILMLIKLNPLYYLVVLPRDIFLFGHSDLWGEFFILSAVLFFIFLFCLRFYYIMEEILVERV